MIKELLQYLENNHSVNALQLAFGDMLVRRCEEQLDDDTAGTLQILGAVTLAVTQDGHSCLNVEAWCGEQVSQLEERLKNVEQNERKPGEVSAEQLRVWLNDWQDKVNNLNLPDVLACSADKTRATVSSPLILRSDGFLRVYLNRYDVYEQNIGEWIRNRIHDLPTISSECLAHWRKEIPLASHNFSAERFDVDAQQQAIYNALQSSFSIVTGGPGRGKTTVLTEILAMKLKENPDLKIALCAPTGKAAARMKQSIDKAMIPDRNGLTDLSHEMFDESIFAKLRELRPKTVHRLLGISMDTDYPKANENNLLDYDMIAVDECSMMSLQLFSQLLKAIPSAASLLLLGDENQLMSVDAGNVLAELCNCSLLKERQKPVIVNRLTENFRSRENPRLCAYTDAMVSETLRPDVQDLYSQNPHPQGGVFQGIEINAENSEKQLRLVLENALTMAGILHPDDKVEAGKKRRNCWKNVSNVEDAFQILESFKILCPLRDGRYGFKNLNALTRDILDMKGTYANGVPILVTKNDLVTGLDNGDIGVCFNGKVYFKTLALSGSDSIEKIREFSPAQLPSHECAFAMTIHKSQGSDYANVLMMLPDRLSPVMTRELVYTGITRTKKNFTLLAKQDILEQVQQKKCIRWSGLGISALKA